MEEDGISNGSSDQASVEMLEARHATSREAAKAKGGKAQAARRRRDNIDALFDTDSGEENEVSQTAKSIIINQADSVIILSMRLPVKITRGKDGKLTLEESQSAIYPIIYKLKDHGLLKFRWIGWPGIVPKDDEEKEAITSLLQNEKITPVFLDEQTMKLFNLFVEQHLWLLFHNFLSPEISNHIELMNDLWHAYCDVNSAFVQVLQQLKQENDLVWINNVHLMLVPQYFKRHALNSTLGMYLHTPFPNSDIFRMFP